MEKKMSVTLTNTDYRCRAKDGPHEWWVDEPLSAGGGDTAPDPLAYLMASLGSCSLITAKMYAQRKGWEVGELTVDVHFSLRLEGGEKVSIFDRDLRVKGDLSDEQLQRLHGIVRACPISRILEGKIVIETTVDHHN